MPSSHHSKPDLSLVSMVSATVWMKDSVSAMRREEAARRITCWHTWAVRESRAGVAGPQQQQLAVHW